MWVTYPASLQNVGGTTQMPTCAWNNARRGTWDLPPPVKAGEMPFDNKNIKIKNMQKAPVIQ